MANERARSLRRNMTDAERRLWRELKGLKQLGFHFRRQVPIDPYIVDFMCFSRRLIIEVDGGQHNWDVNQKRDAIRDGFLNEENFRVLRFWNNDVLQNTEGVMIAIMLELEEEIEI